MKLVYETKTCARCGGTGSYSFNMMDGTRCFGCAGTGKQKTPRGLATLAWMDELLLVPASEVKPGDRVKCPYFSGTKVCTVETVGPDPLNAGLTQLKMADIEFSYHTSGSVRRMPTTADIEAGIAYQDSLTKTGKVAKRATKTNA